jgi:hypothetical protein
LELQKALVRTATLTLTDFAENLYNRLFSAAEFHNETAEFP